MNAKAPIARMVMTPALLGYVILVYVLLASIRAAASKRVLMLTLTGLVSVIYRYSLSRWT